MIAINMEMDDAQKKYKELLERILAEYIKWNCIHLCMWK